MSAADTGGAAFPFVYDDKSHRHIHGGMTLRDYFAAKAMVAFYMEPEIGDLNRDTDDVARYAYELADAMLKARQV